MNIFWESFECEEVIYGFKAVAIATAFLMSNNLFLRDSFNLLEMLLLKISSIFDSVKNIPKKGCLDHFFPRLIILFYISNYMFDDKKRMRNLVIIFCSIFIYYVI